MTAFTWEGFMAYCQKGCQWGLQHLFSYNPFACNHVRTGINEGKCYCPDCGCGLIYQWVVLRCSSCRQRLESYTFLHHIVPKRRHCPCCGEKAFEQEVLESPAYFQLHKAQLRVIQELGEASKVSAASHQSYQPYHGTESHQRYRTHETHHQPQPTTTAWVNNATPSGKQSPERPERRQNRASLKTRQPCETSR